MSWMNWSAKTLNVEHVTSECTSANGARLHLLHLSGRGRPQPVSGLVFQLYSSQMQSQPYSTQAGVDGQKRTVPEPRSALFTPDGDEGKTKFNPIILNQGWLITTCADIYRVNVFPSHI